MKLDICGLAHTKWECKYHTVFAPKYRRKIIFKEEREAIRDIIRQSCQWKGVDIIREKRFRITSIFSSANRRNTAFPGLRDKGKSDLMIYQ